MKFWDGVGCAEETSGPDHGVDTGHVTHPREDPQSLPTELRPYLEELVRRTRTVCGPHLVSVFAVGSLALRG